MSVIYDASCLSSPCADRSEGSLDPVLSCQLHTPTTFTLSRRCSVSPSHSSKKKRTVSPVSKSNLSVCKSEAAMDPCKSEAAMDPDVIEISPVKSTPNPFDLGLRRNHVLLDVKPSVRDLTSSFSAVSGVVDCLADVDVLNDAVDDRVVVPVLAVESVSADSVDSTVLESPVVGDTLLTSVSTEGVVADDFPMFFHPSTQPDCVSESSDDDDECTVSDPGVPCRFVTASAEELARINAGGLRKSWRAEQWAAKAFDEWRAFRGYSTS